MNRRYPYAGCHSDLSDYGPEPFVVNIDRATKQNCNYRTALWTGKHLQLTLMSIPPGGEIGLETHPHLDQFIRIEDGFGVAKMGNCADKLNYQMDVCGGYAVFVPAGTWHNIINTGSKPIKLYSIYAPPQHPHGTVQATKADAEHEERKEPAKPEKCIKPKEYIKCEDKPKHIENAKHGKPEVIKECVKHGECDEFEEFSEPVPYSDSGEYIMN